MPAAPEVLAAFPRTRAALEACDPVPLHGVPMEAVGSIRAPGVTIHPHFGLANSRLTVHLPIDVPAGCSLTVA
ncbi:beta-hydroxylase, partial [Enterococcus hirae]